MPVVDPEDGLVLANPLCTGVGLVPSVRGSVQLMPYAKNVAQERHKFKIIWLTSRGFCLAALSF